MFLLILMMMKTITIGYVDTSAACPDSSRNKLDDGYDGRQYCRPSSCRDNVCLEGKNKVTCKRSVNKEENCAMILNWKIPWVESDIYSCVIHKDEAKFVKNIRITELCRSYFGVTTHVSKLCRNTYRCNLQLEECNRENDEIVVKCQAEGQVPLVKASYGITMYAFRIVFFMDGKKVIGDGTIKADQHIDCRLSEDQFNASAGLSIVQKCRNGYNHMEVCRSGSNCSLTIRYFLNTVDCNIVCSPMLRNNSAQLLKKLGKKVIQISVETNTTFELDTNERSSKVLQDHVEIDSPITCEIKLTKQWVNYPVILLIVKQECGSQIVSQSKCPQKLNCTIHIKPCRNNANPRVICQENYTLENSGKPISKNMNLQWNIPINLINQHGNPINENDIFAVEELVTCQIEDQHNLIEKISIEQTCTSNIKKVQHCWRKTSCSLPLNGSIVAIDCELKCVAKLKIDYSKILLNGSVQKRRIYVKDPDIIIPMIAHNETALRNHDIIHVNNTRLSCALKYPNGTTPKHIAETTVIHIRLTTQCSSIVRSIECRSIYGCNASIAHCQYLDRVHVTCAEYYSKQILRVMLYRRIDGVWGEWWPWTSWNPLCGGGTSTRKMIRHCDSPYPKNRGKNCTGSDVVRETRMSKNCTAHPMWSAWSDWTPCSLTCDVGRQMKSRSCLNSQPESNVAKKSQCIGRSTSVKNCMQISCSDYRIQILIGVFLSVFLGVPAIIIVSFMIYSVNAHFQRKNTSKRQASELLYLGSSRNN